MVATDEGSVVDARGDRARDIRVDADVRVADGVLLVQEELRPSRKLVG